MSEAAGAGTPAGTASALSRPPRAPGVVARAGGDRTGRPGRSAVPAGVAGTSGPVLVLMIEDDVALASSLRLVLVDEGFEVRHVVTAADGLRELASSPDIVLLNLGLPDEDGVVLCRRLRAATAVPVLIISARAGIDDVGSGLAAGADDYLSKPFATVELVDRMHALLDRPRPAESRSLGDLEFDSGTEVVSAGRQVVPLSRTEFRLLWQLTHAPGQPVSVAELIRGTWGRTPAVGRVALDVRLESILDKLREAGSSVRIVRDDGRYLMSP